MACPTYVIEISQELFLNKIVAAVNQAGIITPFFLLIQILLWDCVYFNYIEMTFAFILIPHYGGTFVLRHHIDLLPVWNHSQDPGFVVQSLKSMVTTFIISCEERQL